LILARLLPVAGQLELSTTAGYLPEDEIGDLKEKMLAAKTADLEQYPDASHHDLCAATTTCWSTTPWNRPKPRAARP
jgi:hypothetical protein